MKIKQFTPFILLLMLVISLLTACNKEKSDVTPNTFLKVDKVTISDGTFRNYTYDALGRRARVDYKDYYVTYDYNGNTVISTPTYFDPSKAGIVYTYTLNAQGLVSKYTYKSGSYTYTVELEHDSNGRIIKTTNKNYTSSINYEYYYTYDSDGDLVTQEYRSPTYPTSNYIEQCTVDKSHYNTTDTEFSGFGWFGKYSLHPITKIVRTNNNGTKTVIDFPITYDAKGYIQSEINSYTLNSNTVTATTTANYTYK